METKFILFQLFEVNHLICVNHQYELLQNLFPEVYYTKSQFSFE